MKSLELVQGLVRLALLPLLLLLLLHATAQQNVSAQPVDVVDPSRAIAKANSSPSAPTSAAAASSMPTAASSSTAPSSSSASFLDSSAPAKVIYDQRQSGKYNIRISIKDVAIIEMDHNGFGDGTFSDEDYYYDDADLTVKPITLTATSTTARPMFALVANNTTTATIATTATSVTPTSSATASNQATHAATLTGEQLQPAPPAATAAATTTAAQNIYSPNLLADINATPQQNPQSTNVPATSTPPPPRRTPNVIILSTTPAPNDPQSMYPPSAVPEARHKHIPVHLVLPMMQSSRQHGTAAAATPIPIPVPFAASTNSLQQQLQQQLAQLSAQQDQSDESRVYNFKMQQRSNKPPPAVGATPLSARHCRLNQYRDNAGHCRAKRSTSFLRKLFSMFAAFPFVRVDGVERDGE